MIRARLAFQGHDPDVVARSLEPDNLPEMRLQAEGDLMCLEFCVEKVGTLLSTVDDLLMNIKIAEETLVSSEER
ncbi:MAG TPA: KEOPS complex subunit Pcc1 [Methanothrix sp.]|nr:KEOPS complex subunit Pcc1 [Methanothrix sp.]